MDLIDLANTAVAQLEAADRKAAEAQLAFSVGDFDAYMQRQYQDAEKRVEEMYADLQPGSEGPAGGVSATSPDSAVDHGGEHVEDTGLSEETS